MIFHGDCYTVLDKIKEKSVDLIYLDPPFFTQKQQKLLTRDGSTEYSFTDSWQNIIDYRNYIKLRLEKLRRVLSDSGSIFLHCDRTASHHLRLILDEVFGENNFQSEIIWAYRRWSNGRKGLLNCHQVIFFYSKTDDFKFNQIYEGYSPTTNVDQILQERVRDKRGKAVYKVDHEGNSVLSKQKKGVPLSDVWHLPYLNPKAEERVGYPTQKPIHLLEKIISLVTDEGDTVLDPFSGSGTTLVAAKLLGRNYIGIDQNSDAVELSKKRLSKPVKSESKLLKKGVKSYIQKSQDTLDILEKLGAIAVQRNKGIDGFASTSNGMVPIKIQKSSETLEQAIKSLLKSTVKNNYARKILITLENQKSPFEQGISLFSSLEEAKAFLDGKRSIDIT